MDFVEEIKKWSGSRLMRYVARDGVEKSAVDAEISRRLDENVPKIVADVFNFFDRVVTCDEEEK